MTVLASTGVLSYGKQSAKGSTATTWYRHRATDIDFGPVQTMAAIPLEVGGTVVPTGSYKQGAYVAGGATLHPRMEGDFGWIMEGLMGSVSTDGGPVGDTYDHTFKFNSANPHDVPWMSVRKFIPGSDSLGEIGTDCKVASATMTFPQNGIMQARIDWIGRTPSWDDDPSFSYADAFEDYTSIPVTSMTASSIKLPEFSASELPVTALTVTMTNNLTTPQQEMVIGSQHPDDFTVVSRAATIRATVKWADPDLYQTIYTGTTSGVAWDDACYYSDFEAIVLSPYNITGSTPYRMEIDASNVAWQVDGPVRLAGGDLLMLNLMGTVVEADSGDEYIQFMMRNGQEDYDG